MSTPNTHHWAAPAMASRASHLLAWTAIATLVATYALLALGSTVRVTESGMGCPGWPLCYGQLGPIDHFHTLLEQVHRYLAAAVSVGVLAVVVGAWRLRVASCLIPALVSLGVLVIQVLLGGLTVVTHNAPATVALHLGGALLLLAATTVTAAASWSDQAAPERLRPSRLEWSALGATFVLLVSGSIVVDGGASASCRNWPWCGPHHGVAAPLVAIALVHRAMAGLAVLLIVALAWKRLGRRIPASEATRRLAMSILGACAAQIATGAVTAILGAPPAAQDVHLALAAGIWVLLVALVLAGARRVAGAAEDPITPRLPEARSRMILEVGETTSR